MPPSIFRYPGGKTRLAPWIASYFPTHHSYLEAFAGSAAVLLNKQKSRIETINDLDNEVVNFFDCLKKNPEKLAYMAAMTPYSREIYNRAFSKESEEPYEKALHFLVRCCQGQNAESVTKAGWRRDRSGRENSYNVKYWNNLPENIELVARRLKEVQIENYNALKLIKSFNEKNVLIYADPPYLQSTRKKKKNYSYEMNEMDHEELLDDLLNHKGPAIISGYSSALYEERLKEWQSFSTPGYAGLNGCSRVEKIWLNYPVQNTIFDLNIC